MSLLLLAKYPHLFRSAVSVAPVTSWGLYDTGYTERYLSQPSTNEAVRIHVQSYLMQLLFSMD